MSSVTDDVCKSDYYFDSYSHFGIHEEMLKDDIRTNWYRRAIENNSHLFKDKIVLDVGSGTGILSLFAARAGAKKVYAVEFSSIAIVSRQIIADNGISCIIEVIQGKMEEVSLPVVSVDIIISEWMGYCLLYESNKYLHKSSGIILPDQALLYICGIEDDEYKKEKINFWDNVYGFNMSAVRADRYREPLIDICDHKCIATSTELILHINLLTCTIEDLTFTSSFNLKFERNDTVHAFVCYFDVLFTAGLRHSVLSTSPEGTATHWKQTVFYTRNNVTANKGEEIIGKMSVKPNAKNARAIDVGLSWSHGSVEESAEYEIQ